MKSLSYITILLTVGSCLTAEERPARNILFIMVDDLGWVDLGCYGSEYYRTPHIDALAANSLKFTQAYAASPLCSPTRAAALTGMSPERWGITEPRGHMEELDQNRTLQAFPTGVSWSKAGGVDVLRFLPPESLTIAEILNENGYQTAHFGKWHLGKAVHRWPENHGFEINVGGTGFPGPPSYFSPYKNPRLDDGEEGEYLIDRMGNEVADFLSNTRDKNRPFFISYWPYAVHTPLQAPAEAVAEYAKIEDPRGVQASPTMGVMIERLDQAIGNVMDTLKAEGLLDSTLVVLTSDNGGAVYVASDGVTATSNVPLRGGKGTVWEGGTRVPLLVRLPGSSVNGEVTKAMAITQDFFPTFLEWVGLPVPADVKDTLDGVSLMPLLEGEIELFRDRTFHWHFPHENAVRHNYGASSTLRQGNWKLHRYYHGQAPWVHSYRLYQLEADPSERIDLAEEFPDRVAQMDAVLTERLSATGGLIPLPNVDYDPTVKKSPLGVEPSAVPGVPID